MWLRAHAKIIKEPITVGENPLRSVLCSHWGSKDIWAVSFLYFSKVIGKNPIIFLGRGWRKLRWMLNITQNKSFHQCHKYDQGKMVLIEFSLSLKTLQHFLFRGRDSFFMSYPNEQNHYSQNATVTSHKNTHYFPEALCLRWGTPSDASGWAAFFGAKSGSSRFRKICPHCSVP